MFVSKLEDVHESMRDKFVEHEKDGVSGFIDVEEKKAIDMLFHIKEEKKKYQNNIESLNSELTSFKESEAQKIEQARADALEKAKKENNVDDILRIEREKIKDEKRRIEETVGSFNERMQTVAKNQEASIASSLSSELATTGGKKAFERLIAPFISVDPMTGLETYLNDDGGASSLNREQFIVEIKKNDLFSSLIKADIHTRGGGGLSGNGGVGDPKDPKKMTSKERVEFKQRDPEGFKRAFNL